MMVEKSVGTWNPRAEPTSSGECGSGEKQSYWSGAECVSSMRPSDMCEETRLRIWFLFLSFLQLTSVSYRTMRSFNRAIKLWLRKIEATILAGNDATARISASILNIYAMKAKLTFLFFPKDG